MNERIKELYSKISGKDWMYDFDPDKAEMIAELIVRECADVAFLEANSRKTQRAVLQHFGVEE